MTKTASTLEALEGVLKSTGGSDDDWGDAERLRSVAIASSAGSDSILGSKGHDPNFTSLEMESSYMMRTGAEPSHEELMEYLDRFKLATFLTDCIMYVAKHLPPDPFDFLLNHIHAMVLKHRAAQTEGMGASETKAEHPSFLPPQKEGREVTDEQRQKVVSHVVTALQHGALTNASAQASFKRFGSGEKMSEEDFGKFTDHLEKDWGFQPEDSRLMLNVLKRWRFRANVANGTRGMPLWPLVKADFCAAYPALLRYVRDRYVPIGGSIHRSLFIGKAHGSLEDSYELGIKLGRGAFGEVRLVTLKATKDKRVNKQCQRVQQKVPEEDLVSEVDLLRGIDHPHIIRVFEYFESEEFVNIIMEPVFGGTLTHLVQGLYCNEQGEHLGRRPTELKETWIAVSSQQLLSALEYAHNVAGVIHKDLKTDNVLLVAKPKLSPGDLLKEPVHVMLADFGIAEVFSPLHPLLIAVQEPGTPSSGLESPGSTQSYRGRSDKVGGTPSYMSPEMFKGSFTERSDIWSMGVMVYQLMTGKLPYKGDNLLMQAHVVCNPRRHPDWNLLTKYGWSLGARWFCQQLLSKEESARPTAQEAARDPWLSKTSVKHEHVPPTESERSALHAQHLESHLMKMALTCVTSQLSLSQMHHMNLRFQEYDTSGDGRLGHVEMRQVLEDVGVEPDNIDMVIESLDSDHSGVIEYSEFVAGCMDVSSDNIKQQLRVAFNIFDLDGSGSISVEELRHVLTEGVNTQGLPTRPTSPQTPIGASNRLQRSSIASMLPDGKTVEQVMAEVDVSKDGKVEFNEFQQYLLNEHKKAGEQIHKSSR